MSGAKLNADGRLGLILAELRLPTVKRLAADLCDQSDREGWPARQLLERIFELEMGEREVRWFTPRDAALLVEEPGLSELLAGLEARTQQRESSHH